jgi:glycosyltransferase involved in cell wall biosynthesis
MRVIHVAESVIGMTGGMSRVAWHWRAAFEKRGHEFHHLGAQEVGSVSHVRYFPRAAWRCYRQQAKAADIVLVHEPTAGQFVGRGLKTVLVSHGLERRAWQIQNYGGSPDFPKAALKTRLFFPLWRLRGCDAGLRKADGALLNNLDDQAFAETYYGRRSDSICVFRNGVNLAPVWPPLAPENAGSILFIGTWVARKGIKTMARSAKLLQERGVKLKWVLAGTGLSKEQVLATWPECLHGCTEIIPQFTGEEEAGLYHRCNLFVLPSFFEGQPLALLQAMAYGRCCITTNICGQKDVVRQRSGGLLFEPGDAPVLAKLIEESAANLPLQIELGKNARRAVEAQDWTSAANKVVDFVERVHATKTQTEVDFKNQLP